MDCGLSCLRMISISYGRDYSFDKLREYIPATKDGLSLLSISKASEQIGFKTSGGRFSIEQLKYKINLPCILYWDQNHFIVLYKVTVNKKNPFLMSPIPVKDYCNTMKKILQNIG